MERLEDIKQKPMYQHKRLNEVLSSFAYTKVMMLAESKSNKYSIGLVKVNPAFTSQIGKFKYMRHYGIKRPRSCSLCHRTPWTWVSRQSAKTHAAPHSKRKEKPSSLVPLELSDDTIKKLRFWRILPTYRLRSYINDERTKTTIKLTHIKQQRGWNQQTRGTMRRTLHPRMKSILFEERQPVSIATSPWGGTSPGTVQLYCTTVQSQTR